MLFSERVLHAAKALAKGCFGHICQEPANADRPIALISLIKYLQYISTSSRSNHRHHITRTLSNNRRTLSPKQWGICLWQCFDSPFTLQNQEDCGHSAQISVCIQSSSSLNELSNKPSRSDIESMIKLSYRT